MPTYVYKNMATGETFEVVQSIKEDAYKIHPETGDPVIRVIQPVGIAFKGSGFYVNDSKSNNPVAKVKAPDSDATESKVDTKADVKAEVKTESKAEAKTEAKVESKKATKTETKVATKASSKSSS